MSEKQEITVENVTIETLGAVAYGDLLATFEKLGVKQCWKPGTKRMKMVQDAIEKLAIIKQMRVEGKTQDEIDNALAGKEEKKEEVVKAAELKKSEEEEAAQTKVNEEVKAKKLTKEQVERNLASIDKNLANNIPAQRTILLKKKEALLKIQEEGDYAEE